MSDNLLDQWLVLKRKKEQIEHSLENELLEYMNLPLNEYYVLFFLDESKEGHRRINDLQKEIGLSQSAMSRMISRMENKKCGSIERHCCEEDKRGIYIKITAIGQEKLNKANQHINNVLKQYFKN